jgi:hypothetical protein
MVDNHHTRSQHGHHSHHGHHARRHEPAAENV